MPDSSLRPAGLPSPAQISTWVRDVWRIAVTAKVKTEECGSEWDVYRPIVRHVHGGRYVRFSPAGMEPFVAYWQPVMSGPAPLLVHTPGYGAEISMHPDLVMQGFNVLAVNPLGYVTDKGGQEHLKEPYGDWPVLHETIVTNGKKGYRQWLANCIIAVTWACRQKETLANRISFFGTSQGGGGALLLASLYQGKGVRCIAADEPFLTNFQLGRKFGGAYHMIDRGMKRTGNEKQGWHTLGYIDTMAHAHRLDLPVLLTAGGADATCMPPTIESLFRVLPSTRSYTLLDNVNHGYTQQFIQLALAWMRMYA